MKPWLAAKRQLGYDTRSFRSALVMSAIDALRPLRQDRPFFWGKTAVVSSVAGVGDFFIHAPLIAGIVTGNLARGIPTQVALRPSMVELGRLCGWEVLPFDNALAEFFKIRKRLSFKQLCSHLRIVRRAAPDVWVDLSGNAVNALLVKISGVRRLATRITRGGRSLATNRLPHFIGENEYTNRKRAAAYLDRELDFTVFQSFLGPPPLENSVVLSITTACRWRNWPLANFLEITQSFPNRSFVLIGFKHEVHPTEEVALHRLQIQKNVVDRLDQLSLIEMIRLVSTAPAVVTNDTSCAHIANAFHRPGAVLFGPENSDLFADPNGLRLFHDQTCPYYPCVQWVCHNPQRWCMELIHPAGVIAHLQSCLAA